MNSLNVLQWNVRSAPKNISDLIRLADKHRVDAFLLSETWLKSCFIFNLPGYNVFRKDRTQGRGGGVAIAVRTNLVAIDITPSNLEHECIAVEVDISPQIKISLVSVYIPPDRPIEKAALLSLFQNFGGCRIIGGDFNAHHHTWCNRTDTRGDALMDVFDSANLFVLNNGNPTRLTPPNAQTSAVDITATSPNLSFYCKWDTDSEPYGSDHYPILLQVQHPQFLVKRPSKSLQPARSTKWKINPEKWGDYQTKCLEEKGRLSTTQLSEVITKCIEFAANETFLPSTSKKQRRRPIPLWWTRECEEAVMLRTSAIQTYRQNKTMEHYLTYQKLAAECKKITIRVKNDSWKAFCSKISPSLSISLAWKFIRHFKNSRNKMGVVFSGLAPWVEDFLIKYTPAMANHPPPKFSKPASKEAEYLLINPITLEELNYILDTPRTDTSPGLDGCPYSFYKNLPPELRFILLQLLNNILLTGEIPRTWTEVVLIPILKPGKSPGTYESYRPISLLNCIRKIFCRILQRRIDYFCESTNLFPASQFAFRRGRGTQDALTAFNAALFDNVSENNYGVACSLDIAGAYDNVSIPLLLEELAGVGFPPLLIKVLNGLFGERTTYVRLNGQLVGPRLARVGLPQGDSLSPILYNLYVRRLMTKSSLIRNRETNPGGKILEYQFADDIMYFATAPTQAEAEQAIQQAINETCAFMNSLGLQISPSKCQGKIFTRHRLSEDPQLQINVNGVQLQCVPKLKFLGVIFDTKLLWRQHIQYICQRVAPRIQMLRALCRTWWGAHPDTMLTFYKGYIRPIFDYACHLYGPAANTHLLKLDRLQFRCLRICLGAMCSSPTDALLVESGEMPLRLRRQMISSRIVLRCSAVATNPSCDRLRDALTTRYLSGYQQFKKLPPLLKATETLSDQAHVTQYPIPNIIPPRKILQFLDLKTTNTTQFADLKHCPQAEKIFKIETSTSLKRYHLIFTDGSKTQDTEEVGGAFVDVNVDHTFSFRLSKHHSSFSAEVIAISEALSYVNEYEIKLAAIFTDSLSCLTVLENGRIGTKTHPLIPKIISQIIDLAERGVKITLYYVPAHQGISGNEIADVQAKLGARSGRLLEMAPPYTDVAASVRAKLYTKWQKAWSNRQKTTLSYIKPKVSSPPWFKNSKDPRRFVTTLTRLRLGHCSAPQHLYRINVVSSNMCPCGEVESANHIILQCINYKDKRLILYETLTTEKILQPVTLIDLLRGENLRIYHEIYQLLCSININL